MVLFRIMIYFSYLDRIYLHLIIFNCLRNPKRLVHWFLTSKVKIKITAHWWYYFICINRIKWPHYSAFTEKIIGELPWKRKNPQYHRRQVPDHYVIRKLWRHKSASRRLFVRYVQKKATSIAQRIIHFCLMSNLFNSKCWVGS